MDGITVALIAIYLVQKEKHPDAYAVKIVKQMPKTIRYFAIDDPNPQMCIRQQKGTKMKLESALSIKNVTPNETLIYAKVSMYERWYFLGRSSKKSHS